ncbi:unnamed protein product [Fraxinus pennsylvanica]|uniref:HAT C-terminal dimerisation domain-containing protein n=1 Tax=Fraxinus pennsylvanica TaxID=56036 RepID=A0AAD1ZDX0_9LAMI|nr:unnamed protein product [Fraxinus pennsylvanica]
MFRNELYLKKQVNAGKEVGELYRPRLPLKRKRSPQPDSVNCNMINVNETESSGTRQRLVRDSPSDNSVTETIPSPEGRVFSEMPASSMADLSVDEAKKRIARFFYETATDFNAVKSPSFLKMMADIHGPGQVIPGCEELKAWILEDAVKEMQNYVEDIKMSTTTCLELMLEKFESTSLFKEILNKGRTITRFVQNHPIALKLLRAYTRVENLIKPSNIRSTVPYLTLENMFLEKKGLKNMFASSEWKTSYLSDSFEGKRVASLVEDRTFWNGALVVLKAAIPIVRVLCLINKNNKPEIGLIYETLDQVKETIGEEFRNNERQYMPFWKQIDDVWDTDLHSPLHCAAYLLNPTLFYTNGFDSDLEVSTGLFYSVIKMEGDGVLQELIMVQSEEYLQAKGDFGKGSDPDILSDVSPALWWIKYGEKYPELQRLAIQILSQSCDGASKFHLKRSLAEKLLTKGGNPSEQQTLRDLIFVNFNLQLKNFQTSDSEYVFANEIDPTNDWMLHDA